MKGKLLAKNKSAFAEYTILDTFEAGIKLTGPEVKSIKLGNIKLKGSYSTINPNTGVLWLVGAHIGAYKPAASVQIDYDPTQSRTLCCVEVSPTNPTGIFRMSPIPASSKD